MDQFQTPETQTGPIARAGSEPATLGESPLWCAERDSLFYVDIAERQVLCLQPDSGALRRWQIDSEPGCIALIEGDPDGLLVARRAGLARLDLGSGRIEALAEPPYDPARQRFNDGKPDARGRFWVGGIDDAREPRAALYRFGQGRFETMVEGLVTGNGLAWSPEGRRIYWADTKAHAVYQAEFDPEAGTLAGAREFLRFEPRRPGQALDDYRGRPDGAAVDADGAYWIAMYEGQRLLRFAPDGRLLQELALPVRCPTMPAFGGADLRTLFITTAREKRPAEELAAQPWAGCVLKLRVPTPGLPPAKVRLGGG